MNGSPDRVLVLMVRIPWSALPPTWSLLLSQAHPLRGVLRGGFSAMSDWFADDLRVINANITGDCNSVTSMNIRDRRWVPQHPTPRVPIA